MATVQLTPARIEILLNNIMRVDQITLDEVDAAFRLGPAALELYHILFPREETDMLQNSKWKWCEMHEYFYVDYRFRVNEEEKQHKILFVFGEGRDMPLPNNCWYEWKPLEPSVEAYKWITPRRNAWCEAKRLYDEKRARLKAQLEQFSSINTLIKQWPSILDFADQAMRDQYNKKPEKKERVKIALDDEFASTAITSRLLK